MPRAVFPRGEPPMRRVAKAIVAGEQKEIMVIDP